MIKSNERKPELGSKLDKRIAMRIKRIAIRLCDEELENCDEAQGLP